MRQHLGFIGSLWILLLLGLLPLVAIAVGPAEPPAQPPAKTIPELQSRVQALMTEAKIPGAGIALIRDGQPVWIGGIGKADIASGRAVDADTRFRIGSITKSFLAIALMQQVERGHLSLEDKLSDIAPEIPIDNPWNATDPVRVKHILEHTAGFDDTHFRHMLPDPKAHSTLDQMREFAPEFHVRWRPGERMSYSNPDYGLAGYLLEKITDRPLQQTITQSVLVPLGMTETVWERAATGPDMATGYDVATRQPVHWDEISMPGEGALISTPRDMARYVQFYLSQGASAPGVLTAASIQRMETASTTLASHNGLVEGYGLANVDMHPDGRVFRGHSGGIPGYRSFFGYQREHGLGFVVLFNTVPEKDAQEIQDQMVGFDALGLDKPIQLSTIAPDPRWVGWYRESNPRNQIFAGLTDLFSVGYVHIVDGHYRFSDPLGMGTHDFDLLPGNQTRHVENNYANGVFARDADGDRVWDDRPSYFIDAGIWSTLVPLYAVVLALLILCASLVLSPVWGWRLLRGKLRNAPQRGLRWWPVAATVCLCVVLFAVANVSVSMLIAAKPTGPLVTIAVGTVLFGLFGLIGLIQVMRHWKSGMHGFVRWYILLASVSAVGLSIWMWYWGLFGVRLWLQ